MRHEHKPNTDPLAGDCTEHWITSTDTYSLKTCRCVCGVVLACETTPVGTVPNWSEWRVLA